MASVIKDPGGRKRVQWCVGTGSGDRRTLRLGIASVRQAEAIKVRIEQVLAAQSTGVLDAEATRWLEGLEDDMHRKLSHLGLVKPRQRHVATLGQLLEHFFKTLSVKPGTRRTYEQTRAGLEKCFGASRALGSITPLECDQWRQAMRDDKLAEATIAKRIKTARQIFKQALRWKLLPDNPLSDMKAGGSANRSRMAFVSRSQMAKVLDACPDVEWRVIVSLARYGGLRCPSEVLPLTWDDIDFDKGIIHVRSCKTEAYQNKDRRIVPLFPELRGVLLEAFAEAEEGATFVIAKHRLRCGNFRTQMLRIIKRAGLIAWPKPFHNLRSSRQTELAEAYPIHVVCAWLGNSAMVAMHHYLQVTDAHLTKAITPAPSPALVHVAADAADGAAGTPGAVSGPAARPDAHRGQRPAHGANVAA